jgi:enoyl-[acyl-carrier-protein] reductase (NADH)
MGLFTANRGSSNNDSLRNMVTDLKSQQDDIVKIISEDQNAEERVSDVLSELEMCMLKLDTIVHRLDILTEALVEQRDEGVRPWYLRIFCR